MPQFKVVITDFSDPDHSLEVEDFKASELNLELLHLDAHTTEVLFPAIADAGRLLV